MNNTTSATSTQLSYTAEVTIIAVFSVLAIVCVLANTLVCYVIITRKTTEGSLKYYVLSLAITDILVGIACIPLYMTKEFANHARWELLESFSHGFDIFLGACSIIHLCLMALDRVVSVTKPLLYHTKLKHRKAALKLLLIPWLLALVFAIIPFIRGSKVFEYYAALILTFLIPIPCIFIIVCYTKLYYTIRQRNTRHRQSIQASRNVNQRRMAKVILCVIVVFVICWIPLVIYYSFFYQNLSWTDSTAFFWFGWSAKFLSYFNSACNPAIYALLNRVFRNGFIDVLKSCFYVDEGSYQIDHIGERQINAVAVNRNFHVDIV